MDLALAIATRAIAILKMYMAHVVIIMVRVLSKLKLTVTLPVAHTLDVIAPAFHPFLLVLVFVLLVQEQVHAVLAQRVQKKHKQNVLTKVDSGMVKMWNAVTLIVLFR